MLSSIEKKILRKVSENQLITRPDLKKFLQNNGGGENAVDTVTKNLVQKNLLVEINPIGSTCYVITQKGSRLLDELKA
ncbi:MAG: hypothetical protein WC613_00955 [Candidatus Aenigmatarchaeota archaeon]